MIETKELRPEYVVVHEIIAKTIDKAYKGKGDLVKLLFWFAESYECARNNYPSRQPIITMDLETQNNLKKLLED